MDHGTNEPQASYRIKAYPAKDTPAQYKNLVLSKWLRSFRFGNEYIKLIPKDQYFLNYQKFIESYLSSPTAEIKFAVLSDDDDVVLGWSLTNKNVLHYIYVNKDFRNLGIARILFGDNIDTVTHLTLIGKKILEKKDLKFVPWEGI